MQIVINLPKKVYNYILQKAAIVDGDRTKVAEAIIDGTPLLKGRGRLLILSEEILKKQKTKFSWSVQDWYSEVAISNATVKIVKADKEEEK